MKCTNCYNTEVKISDYYCPNCGYKLRIKPNSWAIFFIVLFIIAGIFAIYFYNEFESQRYRISSLEYENNTTRNESQTQINNLTDKIRRQKSEIENQNVDISNLKAQLPQSYYTLYSNQYLYNKCAGEYKQAECYFPEAGSTVKIYKQEDGYGLTSIGGWIPMSHLDR
jgi:hypothetical protein